MQTFCVIFPNTLKLANVTPLHKKGREDLKENYRPVSILPALSKVSERIMFAQIPAFFDNVFSKYQCGFWNDYSTQYCLLTMLEKWKICVNKGKVFGALLTDLSGAFDCLDHELLTAKLNAYGFNLPALRLVPDYLSNRKQRIKIENTYSTWMEIIFGVSQGSILGPLLFNIFLADLLFIINDIDIANDADVTDNTDDISKSLEEASTALFQWFENNLLKSNIDEPHLLISSSEN